MVIVFVPLPKGHPKRLSDVTKKARKAIPIITSGITRGIVEKKSKNFLPLERENRMENKAPRVPISVEKVAEETAILRLVKRHSHSFEFLKSDLYQKNEKPDHLPSEKELLKEKKIIKKIGRYKKAYTKSVTDSKKGDFRTPNI
jgi:hypothetical protein